MVEATEVEKPPGFLAGAVRNLNRQYVRSVREGGGCPVEADDFLNTAARRVIKAMHADHGSAVIYPITKTSPPIEWDGDGPLYNFCASFVMPVRVASVDALVEARRVAPYTTTQGDSTLIDAIFLEAAKHGAVFLIWS